MVIVVAAVAVPFHFGIYRESLYLLLTGNNTSNASEWRASRGGQSDIGDGLVQWPDQSMAK